MGHKVNPIGLRLGFNKNWSSTWYAHRSFKQYLEDDYKIRNIINKRFKVSRVCSVDISRTSKNLVVDIIALHPGALITKGIVSIDAIKKEVAAAISEKANVSISVSNVKSPDANAHVIASEIAKCVHGRPAVYKRAIRIAMRNALGAGAQGVKIRAAGRLGGVSIARVEWHKKGRVPLHSFKSSIDYCLYETLTKYGIIGIKVWVYDCDKVRLDKKC